MLPDLTDTVADYSTILQRHGLAWTKENYHLRVGNINKIQGWILDVSVVVRQIAGMLEAVAPYLALERVPFRVVSDEAAAEQLLNGTLGVTEIGRVLSVYPGTDERAYHLAVELSERTRLFKGPVIRTAIRLQKNVYARHSTLPPTIPFELPAGIPWPFKDMAAPIPARQKGILHNKYKPLTLLKIDPKGNVFQGLYLKSLFSVRKCVIKQGFAHMYSDFAGRDICDRLNWQVELYRRLSPAIPLPKIYDLFIQQDTTYMVMEYISGCSLYERLEHDNPYSDSLYRLGMDRQLAILEYLITITGLIAKLHEFGYVHRDIMPGNFLVTKDHHVFLIDMELAYCVTEGKPYPPFTLGTSGFMSPEQRAMAKPTVKEDIYGLGALILMTLTGLTPVKFNPGDSVAIEKNLSFFIGNNELSHLITTTMDPDPDARPGIAAIRDGLLRHKQRLKTARSNEIPHLPETLDTKTLHRIISSAVNGLNRAPVVSANGLWYSRRKDAASEEDPRRQQYSKYPGLAKGLAGPLYLLAVLTHLQVNIEEVKGKFLTAWNFIMDQFSNESARIPAGLYAGSAGLALALAKGIQSGMVPDSGPNRSLLLKYLAIPNQELDLANGLAGQGTALLSCKGILFEDTRLQLLEQIVNKLLQSQNKDCTWIQGYTGAADLGYDDTGIIWFLLQFSLLHQNGLAKWAAKQGLDSLLKRRGLLESFFKANATRNSYQLGDGG
ncbi:MAG TPA: protein kinase, partial [Puia sp.]|nr:protein kinase [Puia sp.]